LFAETGWLLVTTILFECGLLDLSRQDNLLPIVSITQTSVIRRDRFPISENLPLRDWRNADAVPNTHSNWGEKL
jgi:hypothetical protein